MHKSRLMELSQRQRWPSPSYTFTRDGPDHAPLFRATVVVDGAEFCSPGGGSRTAKEAVNLAAKAALENLSQFPGVPPPTKSENQLNHKNQLQIYAQKRGIQPPSYCPIPIGSPHEPLFKSKVIIDGQTFESPKEYRTLKAAEKAAAGLALTSLPQEASLQDQSTLPSIPYKNLLQELAQKEHCPLPCYKTMPNILDNTATFISTVEIRGEIFEGEPGSTKKQAEMNAAKAAFQNFEERRKRSDSSTPVLGGSYMQNELSMQSAGQEIQSGKPGPLVPEISTVSCNKANDSDATALPPDTGCQERPQAAIKQKRGRKKRNTESPLGGPRRSSRLARNEAPTYVPKADKATNLKKRKVECGSTSSGLTIASLDAGSRPNQLLH